MAFLVDYAKAFDILKHSAIFHTLHNKDIVGSHCTTNIKLHMKGPSFNIQKGVKQGDPLTPILFTSVLEEFFKTLAGSWDIKINYRRWQTPN